MNDDQNPYGQFVEPTPANPYDSPSLSVPGSGNPYDDPKFAQSQPKKPGVDWGGIVTGTADPIEYARAFNSGLDWLQHKFGAPSGDIQNAFKSEALKATASVVQGAAGLLGAGTEAMNNSPDSGVTPEQSAATRAEIEKEGTAAGKALNAQAGKIQAPTGSIPATIGGFAGGAAPYIISGPSAPLTMAASGYGQVMEDAQQKGDWGSEASQNAALANAVMQGVIGGVPLGEWLEKLPPALRSKAAAYLVRIGVHGIAGAGQGTAMQVGTNLAERGYDSNQDLTEGLAQQAGSMGVFGAAMALLPGGHMMEIAGKPKAEAPEAKSATPSAPDVTPVAVPATPAGNPLPPTDAGANYQGLTNPYDQHVAVTHESLDDASRTLTRLEGGLNKDGSPRISKKGAVGEYQVTPDTARTFMGPDFDVESLKDPNVNRAVGQTVINHLLHQYDGDMNAVAIAYNAGPGRANEYLTKGPGTALEAIPDKTVKGGIRYDTVPSDKDESWLPLETQKYLANARRIGGDAFAKKPETPVGTNAEPPAPLSELQGQNESETPSETPNPGVPAPNEEQPGDLAKMAKEPLTPEELPPRPVNPKSGEPTVDTPNIKIVEHLAADGDRETLKDMADALTGPEMPGTIVERDPVAAQYARDVLEAMDRKAENNGSANSAGLEAFRQSLANGDGQADYQGRSYRISSSGRAEKETWTVSIVGADGIEKIGEGQALSKDEAIQKAQDAYFANGGGPAMDVGAEPEPIDNGDQQTAPASTRPTEWGSSNTLVNRDAYEAAKARLAAKAGRGDFLTDERGSVDPQDMLDGMTMAAYHIEAGANHFADFAREMIRDLGEWVRPYLRMFYEQVRFNPDYASLHDRITPADQITADMIASAGKDLSRGQIPLETPPTERQAIQSDIQAAKAMDDLSRHQPGNIPAPGPPVERDPDMPAWQVGDRVRLRPQDAHEVPTAPDAVRRIISISDDGTKVVLDGGAIVPATHLEREAHAQERADQIAKEQGDATVGNSADSPSGQESEDVSGSAPERPDGVVASRKGKGSSDADGGASGGRAKKPDNGRTGGQNEQDAGARSGDQSASGLPGPTIAAASGAASGRPDAAVKGTNFVIEPGGTQEARGFRTKARDNLEAITLAKKILSENRPATREEQAILAKYVGWGGLKGAFRDGQGRFASGLDAIGERLEAILNPEELATAARSTQYAHYTAENVIRAMWQTVRDMGFKGGNVFEPGMGIGHFLGMAPKDLLGDIRYQGVEMDHLAASIAKLLYPESGVRNADFTQVAIPENAFDLVIGNPPFSDLIVRNDRKYAGRRFMLHDYFFAKSLDSVRPGGLLGFVTSAGTMNKMDPKAREWMAERAEFLGGVRLPSDAFEQNAGTSVTTDILFFKKRDEPLAKGEGANEPWTRATKVELPTGKFNRNYEPETMEGNVNQWFVDHPNMVLGDEGFFGDLYAGRYGVHSRPGVDLSRELTGALDRLPKDVMTEPKAPVQQVQADLNSGQVKSGSFYMKDGVLHQYRDGQGIPVPSRGAGQGARSKDEIEKIKAYIPVRDAYREVMKHNLNFDKAKGDAARKELNRIYDQYVATHGPLNKAVVTYRKPTAIEIERAREEARADAEDKGEAWNEGSFDPREMMTAKATLTARAQARQRARDLLGADFDEGDFDPASVADIPVIKRPNLEPLTKWPKDPEVYAVAAMENYDDLTGAHSKGSGFHENNLTKESEPTLNGANDGVLWSLNRHGRFDLDAVAEKMGRDRESLIAELGDRLFQDPSTGDHILSDDYLSGDVIDKLAIAKTAAQRDSRYERNVSALTKAIPEPVSADAITMRLGMPWIPAEVVQSFAQDRLRIGNVEIRYQPLNGQWSVTEPTRKGADIAQWETSRVPAHKILEAALNRQTIVLRLKMDDGSTVPDVEGTTAAQDRVQAVSRAFYDRDEPGYVQDTPEIQDALTQRYNDVMNRTVPRVYDGSYLTTPGIASDIRLRPHQQRVIARIIQSGDTYMAHSVGSGKTIAMIASGMEMKRLGLINKPMYVVPNHMLGQFTKEFYETYPAARIKVADEQDFHTDVRQKFIADVAQSDLDAVIITHSAFKRIGVSNEWRQFMIQDELDKFRQAVQESSDRITTRQLQNMMEKLEQKFEAALNGEKDLGNSFEELGVDHLFVDEAHLYRKLSYATTLRGKGITPEGSEAAFDLYAKIRLLEDRRPGRSVVLASGTPITNTMAELFNLSRYMQLPTLQKLGLDNFDAWSGSFGEMETDNKPTVTGAFEPETRFSKFVNAYELYKIVSEVMDIVTPHELSEYVVRPKLWGGERIRHVVPASEAVLINRKQLNARAEAIKARKGPPKKGDDIILSVITDGRLAAVDPRLLKTSDIPADAYDRRSKLDRMIDNVISIHGYSKDYQFYDPASNYQTPSFRGPATQMIFTNLGVRPREDVAFNTNDHIRRRLVAAGVPPGEIAFIRDYPTMAMKRRLFQDVNDGRVRVLVGSTQEMGTGVNAQKRLLAIHNLDPVWYPADDEQRVGRGVRQGNHNRYIQIHDYSTEGTIDATMWDLMATKARFIDQFFRGDPKLREMMDLGAPSVYAQLAAMTSADPKLLELANLKDALKTAQRKESAYTSQQARIRKQLHEIPTEIDQKQRRVADLQASLAKRVDTRGEAFKATVDGKDYTSRNEAADALEKLYLKVFPGLPLMGKPVKIGHIGGFDLSVRRGFGNTPEYFMESILDGKPDYTSIADHHSSMRGVVQTFENRLASYEGQIEGLNKSLEDLTAQHASLENSVGIPYPNKEEAATIKLKIAGLEAELKDAATQAQHSAAPRMRQEPPVSEESARPLKELKRVGAGEPITDVVKEPEPPSLAQKSGGASYEIRASDLTEKGRAILEKSQEIANRLAPGASLAPRGRIFAGPDESRREVGGATLGAGDRTLIAWALESAEYNPEQTVRHEAIHALRRMGLFTDDEWATLERIAEDEGWIANHRIAERYPDLSKGAQLEEAIADQFAAWRRDDPVETPDEVVPLFKRILNWLKQTAQAIHQSFGRNATVDDIFGKVESGEIGSRPIGEWRGRENWRPGESSFAERNDPKARDFRVFIFHALGKGVDDLGAAIHQKATAFLRTTGADRALDKMGISERIAETQEALRMALNPMGAGSSRAQAMAKDFAESLRAVTFQWQRVMSRITKDFTPEQRRRMAEAMDEHGVLLRRGQTPGPNEGLNRLTPQEQAVVRELNARQESVFRRARAAGMHDSEGLEWHFPRMGVNANGSEITRLKAKDQALPKGDEGRNLFTSTGQLKQRKYETLDDTEAALKAKFGDQATVVRDIRAVALSAMRLEQAIAGRVLINKIEAVGKEVAAQTVQNNGPHPDFFTMDHPAFTKWKVNRVKDPDTERMVPETSAQTGQIIFKPTPLYVLKEFEGPLEAVLSKPDPKLWRWLMTLKSKMMSVTLFNPLIHNQVIFGKAFPQIVKQGGLNMSLNVKRDGLLGAFTFKVYRDGGVIKADDAMMARAIQAGVVPIGHQGAMQDITSIAGADSLTPGRSWTAQLLAATLGLGSKERQDAIKRGVDAAGDWFHNKFLWDRIADLQMGLWKGMTDQYQKEGFDRQTADRMAANFANMYAGSVPPEAMSRLSRGILNGVLFSRSLHVTNVAGLNAIVNGLPSDVAAQIRRDNPAMLQTAMGSARAKAASTIVLDVITAMATRMLAAGALAYVLGRPYQDPSQNEKGRTDRVFIGYDSSNTAVYMRVPFGKYADEMTSWVTDPLTYARSIMWGPIKLGLAYLGPDGGDMGYGHKAYDPNAGWSLDNVLRFAGNIVNSFVPTNIGVDTWNALSEKGQDQKDSMAAALGEWTGFSLSHGAPGGPAEGIIQRAKEESDFRYAENRREILQDLKAGRMEEAKRKMDEIRLPMWRQRWLMKTAQNPGARISRSALRDFMQIGSDDEKAEMQKARGRQREQMGAQ